MRKCFYTASETLLNCIGHKFLIARYGTLYARMTFMGLMLCNEDGIKLLECGSKSIGRVSPS
jgi:hypothetical protein